VLETEGLYREDDGFRFFVEMDETSQWERMAEVLTTEVESREK
jgi:hypothetical protein